MVDRARFEGYGRYGPAVDSIGLSRALQAKRDGEFEDFFGFPQRFSSYNNAAADAAQAEYEQAVRGLEGGMDEIRGGDLSRSVQDFYTRQAGGELQPYDEAGMRSLVTSATSPLYESAAEEVRNARNSFASRGLSRSGMLTDLEARYRMGAAQQAAQQGAALRANLVGQNFASRERGGAGLASHFGTREGLMNSLRSNLANLRASREFDPAAFMQGGGIYPKRTNPTAGGFTTQAQNLNFTPPQRSAGPGSGSAPRYGQTTRVA